MTLWDVTRGVVSVTAGLGLVLGTTWYVFMMEREGDGVEHVGNEDADKALDELEDEGKGKKKGKGKEEKNEDEKNGKK